MNSKKTRKKRAKKLPRRFPCSCGHIKELHMQEYYTAPYEWCAGHTLAARNKYGRLYNCECEQFVPDNLKYLEECVRKKGKGE